MTLVTVNFPRPCHRNTSQSHPPKPYSGKSSAKIHMNALGVQGLDSCYDFAAHADFPWLRDQGPQRPSLFLAPHVHMSRTADGGDSVTQSRHIDNCLRSCEREGPKKVYLLLPFCGHYFSSCFSSLHLVHLHCLVTKCFCC